MKTRCIEMVDFSKYLLISCCIVSSFTKKVLLKVSFFALFFVLSIYFSRHSSVFYIDEEFCCYPRHKMHHFLCSGKNTLGLHFTQFLRKMLPVDKSTSFKNRNHKCETFSIACIESILWCISHNRFFTISKEKFVEYLTANENYIACQWEIKSAKIDNDNSVLICSNGKPAKYFKANIYEMHGMRCTPKCFKPYIPRYFDAKIIQIQIDDVFVNFVRLFSERFDSTELMMMLTRKNR